MPGTTNMPSSSQHPECPEQAGGRQTPALELLYEIAHLLDEAGELSQVLEGVLASMARHMGMLRGTVTLLNRASDEIVTDVAYGLSASEQERGRYQVGEGVTGQVVKTGKPMVVPRISQAPLFLDRTGARKSLKRSDISFICVPIKLGSVVVGALSADRAFSDADPDRTLEGDVRYLSIIAFMIAYNVAVRRSKQEEENRKEALEGRSLNIIGNSRAMALVFDMIGQVSKSDATVLLCGESGVGKEVVAEAIHKDSLRANEALIKVNCAALPETMLESELFGHEKGAFTGAIAHRKGRFELAHRGTIFLDEIGDISQSAQVKLLRILQQKEFERIGGTETIKSDVRIIAATHRNLEASVGQGTFRQDLYYRLNVFPIYVPPLRERRTDVLLLADYFVEKYARANGKDVRRISTSAIDMLMAYHWPGNVRELENCMERAVLLSNDHVIRGHHLPPTLQTAEASDTSSARTLQDTLDSLERDLVHDALKAAQGNIAKAARSLGVSERVLGLRVKKYSIDARRYRTS